MARPSTPEHRVEDLVRSRLRSLRVARQWTLDDLASRYQVSASTISRLETGQRRLAIDHLMSLARALETTVDELLTEAGGNDVVIRPIPAKGEDGAIQWPLSRPNDPSGRVVAKLRIPAAVGPPDPRLHPGRDWFFVLEGTARLLLGEREYLVEVGQAAEFDTMTPHWIAGYGSPVEILSIFGRDGDHAHFRPAPVSGGSKGTDR